MIDPNMKAVEVRQATPAWFDQVAPPREPQLRQ